MLYSLDLTGLPAGAGEAVLPLAQAKQHLHVLHDDDDDLITALRDAAVVAVEEYTALRLTPRADDDALVLRGEALPLGNAPLRLFARPVTNIVSVAYRDAENGAKSVDVATLRIVDGDSIAPVPGQLWPTDCEGALVVTFEAGLAAGKIPAALGVAASMLVATWFTMRESVTTEGATIELPHGFKMLCGPYRRVRV